MMKYTLCSINILLYFSASYGQLNEGDRCFESHVRSFGTCRRYNQCNIAYEATRSNINLDTCNYYSGQRIICCVDSLETTRNRWTSTNTNNDDDDEDSPLPTSNSGQRIATQKCEQYSKGVTQSFQASFLLTDAVSNTISRPKCDYKSNPLVVGGKETDLGEFPHMAAIGWSVPNENRYEWLCGGSLISERYVLTAGHCTYHSSYLRPSAVRLGDHNINDAVQDGANPITVNIESIIKHPDYKSPRKYNDLALFRLSLTISFNSFVRPACLYTDPNLNERLVIATGWGHTIFKDKTPSSVLRKVPLEVLTKAQCESDLVINRNWKEGLSTDQMCAGDLSRKKDTCQGDSGGPIQIESPTNPCIFYIVGVTGFGDTCSGTGVYAIVSHYLDWIESEVWGKNR